jgi:hypothetical protein
VVEPINFFLLQVFYFYFFIFSFFFYYSYVHTRLGSFLPPAPTPSLEPINKTASKDINGVCVCVKAVHQMSAICLLGEITENHL